MSRNKHTRVMTEWERRPLLSTEILKQMQSIYNRNASQSPLLRLIPELRNRIWRFVLGGHTLHVNAIPRKTSVSVCQTREHDRVFAGEIKNRKEEMCEETYIDRHPECHLHLSDAAPPMVRFDLDILLVCHQVHQEAALMPFKENTFSFYDSNALEKLLQKLMLVQARRISDITLLNPGRSSSGKRMSKFSAYHSDLIQDKLSGLKHFTSIQEFPDNAWHTVRFVDCIEEDREPPETKGLLRFQCLALESVTIAAYPCPSETDSGEFDPDVDVRAYNDDVVKWAADMEERLMASPE